MARPLTRAVGPQCKRREATPRRRPIAVTTLKRSPFLPDVPTFIESGMNMEVNAWYGLLTAGKTPRAIVDRLNTELRQVLAEPQTREALLKHGFDPQPNTAEWSKVVQQAGIPRE